MISLLEGLVVAESFRLSQQQQYPTVHHFHTYTLEFCFQGFLVGTRKESKYLLHVLKKLHSDWLDGTYPQSAGEKPSSC